MYVRYIEHFNLIILLIWTWISKIIINGLGHCFGLQALADCPTCCQNQNS